MACAYVGIEARRMGRRLVESDRVCSLLGHCSFFRSRSELDHANVCSTENPKFPTIGIVNTQTLRA